MKQRVFISSLCILTFLTPYMLYAQTSDTTTKIIAVPYISQAPDGNWSAPWNEACEEASITMVEVFYHGTEPASAETIKTAIRSMVTWENQTFRKNDDTDAEETVQLIDHLGTFQAMIHRQPTIQELKKELDENHPIIALLNMYDLYEEHPQGDSYHVVVLTGYDDAKKEFFLQDPARSEQKSYAYEKVVHALHDYNPKTKEADGVPTVLFTSPLVPSFSLKTFLMGILNFFRHLLS